MSNATLCFKGSVFQGCIFEGQLGSVYDWDAGLLYCQNRYYAGNGRWLTRDPIGLDGGLNVYSFCGNNPLTNADPSGLEKIVILLGILDNWYDKGVQNMILERVEKICASQHVDFEEDYVDATTTDDDIVQDLKGTDGFVFIGHGSIESAPYRGVPIPSADDNNLITLNDEFIAKLNKARHNKPLDFVWLLSCFSDAKAKNWLAAANFVYTYWGGVNQFINFMPRYIQRRGRHSAKELEEWAFF